MLNLIEGGFFSGGREALRERIAALTEQGKRSILIVPEQQTVSAEREMTDFLPPSAPLCFETTNFTRLANTVFRALGGLAGDTADTAKRSLLMWKTLTELSVLLETTCTRGEISAGSVSKMLGTVKQMQSYAITPADLADTADALESAGISSDARLTAKLRDVSKIMALYKKLLGEKYADADDSLLIAAQKMSQAPEFLSDHEIFIDGFTSFTEPQYKLLRELLRRTDVTAYITLPKSAPDAFEYAEMKATHDRLVRLASEISCDVKLQRVDGRFSGSLMISELSSLLWRSNVKIDGDAFSETDALHLYEAENPYEECAFVANDIKRRVMEGAKYSDFGIIARSIESYSGILDVAFEKAGVPLFTSARSDVGSYEVIKLIYSAFAAVSGGFKQRDVISYSKCSLCGVDRNLADEFELYVERWQINGKRFTDGVFWNMNPDGYSTHRSKSAADKLLLIDRARQAITEPLIAFSNALADARTVKDYATALVDFLVSLDIENALKTRSAEEQVLRGAEAARDVARLWGVICDALDSLCDVLADSEVNTDTFITLLRITFAGTDIGRIPSFTEQVTAASADMARMNGKKHIYIIGANAGVFPAAVNDTSYFTDKDKRTLAGAGLPIDADTDVMSAKELYLFERAISYARVGVSVIYSALDTAFKAIPPSDAVKRITELTDKRITPTVISSMPIADRAFSAEYALEHIKDFGDSVSDAKDALRDVGFGSHIAISETPIKNTELRLSAESLSYLYGESIATSQSRLEAYAKCPMSYFCKYDLGISAEERAEFDSRNIGTFIHAILESFFTELRVRGKRIVEITDEEKQALILRVSTEYIRKCFEGIPETSARVKDTINKLCRASKPIIDGLCDEFSSCKYEPVFFELEIAKNKAGMPEPIVFKTTDGKELYLTGKIDRVDTYKSGDDVYIRVIDYKSGNKIFSPEDIKKGLNLQMFLYLKALVETENADFRKKAGVENGGKMIPAGVIYVKTSIEDAKISTSSEALALDGVKKNQARIGMLLDDMESISAMNADYIPIKLKDGVPDTRSSAKLYTESGWDALNETISEVVSELGSRMTAGDVSAFPMLKSSGKSEVCQYCEFKAICRNAHPSK